MVWVGYTSFFHAILSVLGYIERQCSVFCQFQAIMYYLCTSEEERAPDTGLSPLFFVQYKGRNTSEIEATVKMRRFAAASIWRKLYYVGHSWKAVARGTKAGRRGLNTHRFRDRA